MKPIILNMEEMSDSRELYDSRPNIFFTLFIYFVLIMFVIAFVWMYFGRIDVVVKSEAVLRPNEQVSTVVNEYDGAIEQVNIEDGDRVKQGDVLYSINHTDLVAEKEYQETQLADTKETLQYLNRYKKSIEDNQNYFQNSGKEEAYYIQFETYYLKYETMKKEYNYSEAEIDLNISSASEQLEELSQRLAYYKRLKSSIEQGKSLLSNYGEEKVYYNLYEKYKSDYQTIDKQFDAKKQEIQLSITQEGVINSLEYYNAQLTGYKTLKKSVEYGQNYFTEENSYSLRYKEYLARAEQLNTAYLAAKEEYELNLDLKDYGVSEQEIKTSKTDMEEALDEMDQYKVSYLADLNAKITEVEKNSKDLNLQKENSLSKKELLSQNEMDRKAALKNFKLQYFTDLNSKIIDLDDTVTKLEENLDALTLQDDKTYIHQSSDNNHNLSEDDSRLGSLLEYKNLELQTTITNIKSLEEKVKELEVNIGKVETAIGSAIVTANRNGVVNTNVELVEGNTLAAGTQVLTVIPDGSNLYKANIYVSNEDIGKIKLGMKIKCNVYALPNSEYGYLKGTVSKISKDIKVDAKNSAGYYLVQADLEQRNLYDQHGKEANLKVGMSCQAQIITENKRILTYLLEKLDFWS